MPSADVLFASPKKVFAHYFYPFPVSIDDAVPANDYYNDQYLNRLGESGKWLRQGGFLRQRPLGVNPSSNLQWKLLNMESEVRRAIARGITGFTIDVMSVDQATNSNSALHLMLAAAHAVDSRFKIMVMPDISVLKTDVNSVVTIIASVAGSPAAYRLSDGRLVVSAFDAGLNTPAWWETAIGLLGAQGIKVAFVPTFLGWTHDADTFAPFSYGYGDWGTATAAGGSVMLGDPQIVHDVYGKIFMMPVDPQQYRPKDFVYWEAGNSAAFRNAWMSSINGGADWVQLVTWNDFSESSEIAPYTDATLRRDIGTGYYDLTGFYAAWFLTGNQPTISHDVLYYFYRRETTTAAGPAQGQKDYIATGVAEDDIELLAFLPAAGELKITIGGKSYTKNAAMGVTSFKIPSQPGSPVFTLSRNGAVVFSFAGGVQIYGSSGIPSGVIDLTYWSGSAAKSGVCSL
jgi:Glycosyl hydrolase family 71